MHGFEGNLIIFSILYLVTLPLCIIKVEFNNYCVVYKVIRIYIMITVIKISMAKIERSIDENGKRSYPLFDT